MKHNHVLLGEQVNQGDHQTQISGPEGGNEVDDEEAAAPFPPNIISLSDAMIKDEEHGDY